METLALLQASMVAVSSEMRSGSSVGKPAEKRISILRPGTVRRFFARLRTASNMVRAPKSDSALLKEEKLVEATMVEGMLAALCALVSMLDCFTPLTAAVRRSVLEVKFWRMVSVPPKSTTAIKRSAAAVLATNLAAAARA